jgi:hypothetical protein
MAVRPGTREPACIPMSRGLYSSEICNAYSHGCGARCVVRDNSLTRRILVVPDVWERVGEYIKRVTEILHSRAYFHRFLCGIDAPFDSV